MLNLSDRDWREFFIEEVCEIHSGVRLTKADMRPGKTPFIGASDCNNGITAFVSNTNNSYKANVLGVNYNGSIAESFFHPYAALFSDDVKQFEIKVKNPTKYMYLFLKTVILQQKSKFAYGYKFNEQRMRRQIILLPVSSDGDPDWHFMEEFIKERESGLMAKYMTFIQREIVLLENMPGGGQSLDDLEWREFSIRDIFDLVQRGKRIIRADQVAGQVPYISAKAENNGFDSMCGNSTGVRKFKDCITVANSGSVGASFYHPYAFVASDHVTALRRMEANKFQYLFLKTLLSRLGEKYSFNREMTDSRLKKEKIILPADSKGEPAWDAMNTLMMQKEAAALKKYLRFKCQTAEKQVADFNGGR